MPPKAPEVPLGKRKRVLAASLASTDNVDPLAIKRRKLVEANAAAQALAAAPPLLTIEIIRDPSPDPFELNLQRLEAGQATPTDKTADIEEQLDDANVHVEEI